MLVSLLSQLADLKELVGLWDDVKPLNMVLEHCASFVGIRTDLRRETNVVIPNCFPTCAKVPTGSPALLTRLEPGEEMGRE